MLQRRICWRGRWAAKGSPFTGMAVRRSKSCRWGSGKGMKIYTKTGDTGETSFFGCCRVEKNDPRIEALGTLDELNSVIGVTLCFVQDEKLKNLLSKIQNDLFRLGADVAGREGGWGKQPRITLEHG